MALADVVVATLTIPLTLREALSGITGSISLAAWLFLLIPQLVENYKRKSADAVSLGFLCTWLVGDTANIIGTIWAGLVPTIIAIGVYYLVSDIVLISQCMYYNTINARRDRRLAAGAGTTTGPEDEPLLTSARDRRRSSVASRKSNNPLLRDRTPVEEAIKNVLSILFIGALGTAGWFVAWKSQAWRPQPDIPSADDDVPLVAEILGYTGAVLFLGARTPQIIKNYRAKSCDGFALLFPIIAILGNITFAASIVLHSTERAYIIKNIPWLIGSLGTIFMDLILVAQVYMYKDAGRQDAVA